MEEVLDTSVESWLFANEVDELHQLRLSWLENLSFLTADHSIMLSWSTPDDLDTA